MLRANKAEESGYEKSTITILKLLSFKKSIIAMYIYLGLVHFIETFALLLFEIFLQTREK